MTWLKFWINSWWSVRLEIWVQKCHRSCHIWIKILVFRVKKGFWELDFRVEKGFESPISNFEQGFWEPDFKFLQGFSEPDFKFPTLIFVSNRHFWSNFVPKILIVTLHYELLILWHLLNDETLSHHDKHCLESII